MRGKAEGGRRGAEIRIQEIKSQEFHAEFHEHENFMQCMNFMRMKIPCNDELPEYNS
jgi:hypothetical protein